MSERSERPSPSREFGRDGISGMVTWDRQVRAREVSKPTEADIADAEEAVQRLIARTQGRSR